MDYLTRAFTVKSEGQGRFYGYASVFEVEDAQRESVLPGAFHDTLAAHCLSHTMPWMLYEHQNTDEIGVWQRIEEDAHGLWVEGQLNLNHPKAQHVFKAIQSDQLCGLSIGFMPTRRSYHRGIRHIHKLNLFEISLVHLPANPLAVGICARGTE